MNQSDKMFEELGYEAVDDDKMEYLSNNLTDDYIISFWNDKTFSKCNDFGNEAKINTQELKAIIKKCEELKWI